MLWCSAVSLFSYLLLFYYGYLLIMAKYVNTQYYYAYIYIYIYQQVINVNTIHLIKTYTNEK